jgi:CBS domain-containing protein
MITIQDLIHRPVVTLPPSASCMEAAGLMRDANVGAIVVAEDREPLGVVTDRDLAVRVIAEGRDAREVSLRGVMSIYPAFLSIRRSLDEAVATMRDLGVRRLPIVDEHGHLEGMLSMDDILATIGRQLGQLGEAIRREIQRPPQS